MPATASVVAVADLELLMAEQIATRYGVPAFYDDLDRLLAAERPDEGQVLLFGRDISKLRRASIPYLRRNIGVVFQDFKLLPDRSARTATSPSQGGGS